MIESSRQASNKVNCEVSHKEITLETQIYTVFRFPKLRDKIVRNKATCSNGLPK
jgi:hypothetical protein